MTETIERLEDVLVGDLMGPMSEYAIQYTSKCIQVTCLRSTQVTQTPGVYVISTNSYTVLQILVCFFFFFFLATFSSLEIE